MYLNVTVLHPTTVFDILKSQEFNDKVVEEITPVPRIQITCSIFIRLMNELVNIFKVQI
jgi:hypothetical protein